jgi:hypothetical protein
MDVYVLTEDGHVLGAGTDRSACEDVADRRGDDWPGWADAGGGVWERRVGKFSEPSSRVQRITRVSLAGMATTRQLSAALGEAVRREMAEQPVTYDVLEVEISGSGPHYVWNEDRTGVVPKDGPIDASKPFFLAPEEVPAVDERVWPSGWQKLGATVEAPPALRGEQVAADMRHIFETQALKRADDIRVGDGPAWEWLKAGLDKVATYPRDAPMPDSRAAAMIWGLPVILDPNIPRNEIHIGDVVYVVGPEDILGETALLRFDFAEMDRTKREFDRQYGEWLLEAIRTKYWPS